MKPEDWKEWEDVYAAYEEARSEYESAIAKLRGVFSELPRHYDQRTIDHNRIYEESLAHERFVEARERMHKFLEEHLKKD